MRRRKSRNPRLRGPLQDRSRQTVEAIRQSAIQILEREGVRGLKTQAIAARAGVGIASLYRYFPNREAIVAEVIRSEVLSDPGLLAESLALLDETDPDAWSRLRQLPLSERLRIHVDGIVRAHRALIERFGREFQVRYYDLLREALGIPVGGPTRLAKAVFEDCLDQLRLPDPRLAAPILVAVTTQVIPLLVASSESEELSTEELVDEVLGLLLRYLGVDEPPAPRASKPE
jgi:AcrR family transcriptional regulator